MARLGDTFRRTKISINRLSRGAGRGFQTTGITFTPACFRLRSLSLFLSLSFSLCVSISLWRKLMRGRSRYSLNNRIDSVATMGNRFHRIHVALSRLENRWNSSIQQIRFEGRFWIAWIHDCLCKFVLWIIAFTSSLVVLFSSRCMKIRSSVTLKG